jgi:hypothetical protein
MYFYIGTNVKILKGKKISCPTGMTAFLALPLGRANASIESRFAIMRAKGTGRV